MGIFNKLVNRGKNMAGDYLRDQLGDRSGSGRTAGGSQPGTPVDPGVRRRPSPWGGPRDTGGSGDGHGPAGNADAAAIARYRYMLRTAPPEDMERAHAEAFARLTPQQRTLLREELDGQLPAGERPHSDAPQDLARSATRAEVGRPGFMERLLGSTPDGRPRTSGNGSGRGMGGLAAGAAGGLGAGLLGGVAGAFIGSAMAGPLLDGFSGIGGDLAGSAEGLGDTAAGLGDAAAGLGDTASSMGGEILGNGGGILDGLLTRGEGFLNGGGDGGGTDWEF